VPIDVRLDLIMVKRRMSLTELSARVGISMTNLSLLKTGKVKGVRFSTLEALCRELDCRPGDILEYVPGPAGRAENSGVSPAQEGSDD
jgi:putative transcriptional regulator